MLSEQGEQTAPIDVKLPNGTIVKIEANASQGSGNVGAIEGATFLFDEVLGTIEGIADALGMVLQHVKPDRASVEFGVEVGVESGKLTTLIVKGQGKANLKITLEWGK